MIGAMTTLLEASGAIGVGALGARVALRERACAGADVAGFVLLARPERPRRWTFPITALRVTLPISAAIWLALKPSAQSFLRSSTRSSVQVRPASIILN